MSEEELEISKRARICIAIVAAVLIPAFFVGGVFAAGWLLGMIGDFLQSLHWPWTEITVIGTFVMCLLWFMIWIGVQVYRELGEEQGKGER